MDELRINFYRVSKLDQFCRLRNLCSKTFRSSVDLITDIMVDFINDLDSIKRCDDTLISIKRDNLENLIKNGAVINIKVDDTKQIQLFVACIPKEVALIILYIIVNIISSFKIPRTNAIKNMIIVFEIVKYNPVKPYSIISILSFE